MGQESISWSNYRYGDYRAQTLESLKSEQAGTFGPIGVIASDAIQLGISAWQDTLVHNWVSACRHLGLYLPSLSAPKLTRPKDNSEFLCFAEKRALHLWSGLERKVIEEGLDDAYCDEYEIYSVLGEWAIAAYYEYGSDDSNFYLPTFLEISRGLSSDRKVSIMTVIDRFKALSKDDKRAVLEALYTQKHPPLSWKGTPVTGAAKDVHSDIRALASELHQGNQAFIQATEAYFKQRCAAAPVPSPSVVRPAAPLPSAPPAAKVFDTLTQDVGILRGFIDSQSSSVKSRIRNAVAGDYSTPAAVKSPGDLDFSALEKAPLHALTRLLILQKSDKNSSRMGYPLCFPWGETLRSGDTIRQAMFRMEITSSNDRKKLIDAVLDPVKFQSLDDHLQKRYLEVSEIAEKCLSVQRFRDAYRAYRTALFSPSF